MPHQVKAPTKEIIKLYQNGFSCEQIGNMFSMSRQAVWERLKRKNVKLREKKLLPYIIYNGLKFTISKTTGYYRCTINRKNHLVLHRFKYESEIGEIPEGFDIHHKDGNKQNNNIENLECISKAEHTRLYSPHHNQYKNYKTLGINPKEHRRKIHLQRGKNDQSQQDNT